MCILTVFYELKQLITHCGTIIEKLIFEQKTQKNYIFVTFSRNDYKN